MFEDSTQPKERGFTKGRLFLASGNRGKFYGALLRKLSASFRNNPG
jgi:hypothetical protein